MKSEAQRETKLEGEPELVDDDFESYGVVIRPIAMQSIQNKIDVPPNVLGIVEDGLETYCRERCVEHRNIASSYAKWDEEFPDKAHSYSEREVITGPEGRTDKGSGIRLTFRSDLVRACVRVLSGGGRFKSDEYEVHVGVPHAIVTREGYGGVLIAPAIERLESEPCSPAFRYREGADVERRIVSTM